MHASAGFSGMHMGLLALMLIGLAQVAPETLHMADATCSCYHGSGICCLTAAHCYGFIAGCNMPVIRALIMTYLFILAVLIRRQRSLVHTVAAAALFILLWRPLALFSVSFQLSFCAVLAITVIYPRLYALFAEKYTVRSPGTQTSTSESESVSRKWHQTVANLRCWIVSAFCVSIAATLGTMPLLLYHFNRFSPIRLFINLVVEPLICFWALPLDFLPLPLSFSSRISRSFFSISAAWALPVLIKLPHMQAN